jgi:putative Mg2+ transporter-C (MgtC) family protein
MPVIVHWPDIALRLALATIASFLIGFNRGERGRPAGMRTTMLVCLAACFAMILANMLLDTTGMPPDSFVKFDPMRLPLGILSGIGFIGGGAILRRENMVVGVTTAATIWFVSILGICFGAGEFALGIVATALGMAILAGLWHLEQGLYQASEGTLVATIASDGPSDDEIRDRVTRNGNQIVSWGVSYYQRDGQRQVICQVRRRQHPNDASAPLFVAELAKIQGIPVLQWQPLGTRVGDGVTKSTSESA